MKNFFKKAGKTVAIALAAVLFLICASWTLGGAGIFPLRGVTAPVQRLLDRGVAQLERLFGYMHDQDVLAEENTRLKAKIAELELQLDSLASAGEENERLRSLLKLSEENADFEYIDVRLTAWTADSWSPSFTVNKGTRAGINKGDCVVTEHGFVVGSVTDAGLHSATVTVITSPQSAVGVYIAGSGVKAVARGDFALLPDGRLRMDYSEGEQPIKTGDTVITSGAGGVYPSGLTVGTVSQVLPDQAGYADYGVIEPAADLAGLEQVFVIRSSDESTEH
ncbi:MAG: rod shape-determining protein MreC [Oscillospiraceae bacterium]|nr:rod shape-determining protein MreC [Oscillospiraceae bacterium]